MYQHNWHTKLPPTQANYEHSYSQVDWRNPNRCIRSYTHTGLSLKSTPLKLSDSDRSLLDRCTHKHNIPKEWSSGERGEGGRSLNFLCDVAATFPPCTHTHAHAHTLVGIDDCIRWGHTPHTPVHMTHTDKRSAGKCLYPENLFHTHSIRWDQHNTVT